MKLITSAIALCASLLLVQATAGAAPVLDQSNPTISGGFCSILTDFVCGQSFIQTAGNIAGAGIYISPFWDAPAGDVTIGLFDNISGGIPLAQATAMGVDSTTGWVDVFWAPLALAPASQYFLLVKSTNTSMVATYSAPDYAMGTGIYAGSEIPRFDLSFRTYADDGVPELPEPASLALMGMGLLGLAAGRRSRSRG